MHFNFVSSRREIVKHIHIKIRDSRSCKRKCNPTVVIMLFICMHEHVFCIYYYFAKTGFCVVDAHCNRSMLVGMHLWTPHLASSGTHVVSLLDPRNHYCRFLGGSFLSVFHVACGIELGNLGILTTRFPHCTYRENMATLRFC